MELEVKDGSMTHGGKGRRAATATGVEAAGRDGEAATKSVEAAVKEQRRGLCLTPRAIHFA